MDNSEKFSNSKEVIGFLAETFPDCFSVEGEAKPLKIGIFQDLAERLAEEPRLSKTLLRSSLRHYTNSWRYLHSVKVGAHRVDLDGKEGEVIEEEHASHARLKLEESKQKVAERRKEQNQERKAKRPARVAKATPGKSRGTKGSAAQPKSSDKPATPVMEKLSEATLKVGTQVSVKVGKSPMRATITEVAKDGVHVQIQSGMVLKVSPDSLRVATEKR